MTGKPLKNNLRVRRAMNGWTQEELARRVNVTRKTINTIENGRFVPSTYLALKLAQAFHVAVEDLFEIDEQREPAKAAKKRSISASRSGVERRARGRD